LLLNAALPAGHKLLFYPIVSYKICVINPPNGDFLTKSFLRIIVNNAMAVLSEKDYQEVLDLVYLANSCKDIEQFITSFLPAATRTFRSEIATFHLLQGTPQKPVIGESRSFYSDGNSVEDKYNPKIYKEYYYQQSPLLKEAITSSQQALKIAAVMSHKDWERHDFFIDFILPQNLYWELFLALRWQNKLAGVVTLWRQRKQEDFIDSDLLKGEILAPHLMLVVNNLCSSNTLKGVNGEIIGYDVEKIKEKFINNFHLSEREAEILDGVITGMSYDEIANKCFISRFTVHSHVKNIYSKIGIHNRIDLGRFIQNSSL
jgi:DNA-binding CsgD family transcriptional regulator